MADFGIGEALAIGGAMSAAQAGLSMYSASQKNSALGRAAGQANANAELELKQQQRIVDIQTRQARQSAERVRGLVAVSAANRNVGAGGSTAALDRDTAQQQARDIYGIQVQQYGAQSRVLAQLASVQQGLANQSQDPFMSGVLGGLQGFSTGISIAGGLKNLGRVPEVGGFTFSGSGQLPPGATDVFDRPFMSGSETALA